MIGFGLCAGGYTTTLALGLFLAKTQTSFLRGLYNKMSGFPLVICLCLIALFIYLRMFAFLCSIFPNAGVHVALICYSEQTFRK